MPRIRISLTDFVDIVASSGTPKANKVRQIKNRPEYKPAFDFYKAIRDRIKETHKGSKPKSHVRDLMSTLTDKNKLTAYPEVIDGYLRWWGRKNLQWFDPTSTLFSRHDINVSVNPELGLYVVEQPHLIKLYFKAVGLTKKRIDVILHLMKRTLSGSSPRRTTMAVLDVRRSRLYAPTVEVPNLSAILSAELAYIAELWPNIE